MRRIGVGAVLVGGLLVATACGSSGSSGATSGGPTPATVAGDPCPVEPIRVVVSVNQWGDVVQQLGGECTEVTTIINGGDVDPHDFEPTPADSVAFEKADLVVVNGLDYDHWAEDAAAQAGGSPAVVNAGEVVGLSEGDNPHLWYGPQYVEQVSAAVTDELKKLEPAAAGYFDTRASLWADDLKPLLDEIATLRATATGMTYAATESVFDDTATAVGLEDVTPSGYRNAAANESEPAPGDVKAFEDLLRGGTAGVLIYNTQTEGSVPEQLRSVAERAEVPIVEVTESVPPGEASFVAWQLAQLKALAEALGR